ncbi:MAG: DUF2298 domain-containing protein [Anaerolineae bacterium]|nr:DUF2298 domain-containing protein [Anaerolineae bacterium]
MIADWLAREGWIIVSWWLLVTLAGAAVLPLCWRLLGGLPDKGYTLARAAGLLLVGFVFWFLGSLGFLQNTPGSIVLSWLIVLAISVTVYLRSPINLRDWWRENRRTVIVAELLFAVLLIGWATYRAHQPELFSTEKPMDLMFTSSILRSPSFPPNDAWMSGYSISYYYFGYLLSASLAMMSGVTGPIAMNIMIALLFALTGLTVFGVAYNLVRSRALHHKVGDETAETPDSSGRGAALFIGVLAAVLVILMGNFETVLIEMPYRAKTASEEYLAFWDTKSRYAYPERLAAHENGTPDTDPITLGIGTTNPAEWGWLWWFDASRILTDRDLQGNRVNEVIDEFPQFSFLLADVHPHVLALPFAALALGLALNVLLRRRAPDRAEIILYSVCIGALVFLNTWDGPVYMLALVGAEGLRRLMQNGRGRLMASDWWALVGLGFSLLALTVLFYFPFLVGFRSQASGVLPNLIFPTLFQQYFIMFGPFVFILTVFLLVEVWRAGIGMNWRLGLQIAGLAFTGLMLFMLLLALVGLLNPALAGPALNFIDQNGGLGGVLLPFLERRITYLLTTLVLLGGITLVIGRLFPRAVGSDEVELSLMRRRLMPYPPATGFALLLVGVGLVLTLVPEFVYLRDNFGTRMNTIFKLYYQAWLVFGIASAYAVYTLLADAHLPLPAGIYRTLIGGIAVVVIGMGLAYPTFAIYSHMFVETGRWMGDVPRPLSLDGSTAFNVSPDDYAAIMCLSQLVGDQQVVVAEAVGPQYHPEYGRVASLTGIPIVIGWEGHEGQWRGATYPQVAGSRADDVRRLYTDLRWDYVVDAIQRYNIDYIFYGSTERSTYGSAGEDKFIENLTPVCQQGGSAFYQVTDAALHTN